MKPPRSKSVLKWGIGATLLLLLTFWVLISPGNIFLKGLRGPYSFPNDRVIVGPYPLLDEFRLMKHRGVTLVVSLLDPRLPYEKVLLEEERERAGKFKIRVENFPMVSLWGTPVGADYEGNAQKAAEAVESEGGKVYMHCYLGLHRAGTVTDLLKRHGTRPGMYRSRRDPAMEDARFLTEARKAYDETRYADALAILDKVRVPLPTHRMLRGWTYYRMGRHAEARETFEGVLKDVPDQKEAPMALGYCALREGNLAVAEARFSSLDPAGAEALEGLGIVRYRQGRWTEAAAHLEALLKIHPGNEEARGILEKIRGQSGPDPR